MSKNTSIKDQLGELEGIVKWFESQTEVDVEKGLEKMKVGAVLVKELRAKLKSVENEFEVVKASLEETD